MDDANQLELEAARQYRDNIDNALERTVNRFGTDVAKYVNAAIDETKAQEIPGEARIGISQILQAKAHLEEAEAQICELEGFPDSAASHRATSQTYLRRRARFMEGG